MAENIKTEEVFAQLPLRLTYHAQSIHLETTEGELIKIKDKVRPISDEEYVHIVIARSRLAELNKEV